MLDTEALKVAHYTRLVFLVVLILALLVAGLFRFTSFGLDTAQGNVVREHALYGGVPLAFGLVIAAQAWYVGKKFETKGKK